MPNFKPKAKKKIIPPKKGNITLDNKHNEIMKNMEDEEDNKLQN